MKAEDLNNQKRIRIIRLDTKEDIGYVDCFGYYNTTTSYGKFLNEYELYIIRLVCENFIFRSLKNADTLGERFDEVEIGDWTICYNDHKMNPFSRRYEIDEKVKTFSVGTLYKVLGKKINDRGDMVIKIINDLGKNCWILTDRFAYDPELAANSMREEKLKWLLDDDNVELK